MLKLGASWGVQRKQQGKHYEPEEVSKHLEALMLEKAEQVLKGDDSWQTLEECATWIKQHCTAVPGEEENKALTAVLALIESSPCSTPNKHWRAWMQSHQHKPAITAELGALRPFNKDGKQVQQPQELCKYAFVQHALRECRAHTSLWSPNLTSTAPKGFAGRAGYEHCRANVCDVISMQAHWPFHLAGDSGVRLFEHRAWLSWRSS